MSQLTTINEAVQFIEAHLRDPITVGEVAEAVGYSLYHFSRTFNRIVQHTPYDYLMRRRVSESTTDVLTTERLMIDIAYDYQFANPETFTRAFRRMFGATPSDVRAQGCLPHRDAMPPLSLADLAHRSASDAAKPRPIVAPPLTLIGFQSLIADDASPIIDALWQLLRDEVARRELNPSRYYAVRQTVRPPYTAYSAMSVGIKLDEPEAIAPAVSFALTQRQTIHCPHHGSSADLPLTISYVIHTWLPKARLWPSTSPLLLDYGDRPGSGDIAPLSVSVGVSDMPQPLNIIPSH